MINGTSVKILLVVSASIVAGELVAQQWSGSTSTSGTIDRIDKIKVGYGPLYLDWTYQYNWSGNAQNWAGYVGFNAYRNNNDLKDKYYGANQYTVKGVFEGSYEGFRWLFRQPSGNDSDQQHTLPELMRLTPGGDVGLGTSWPLRRQTIQMPVTSGSVGYPLALVTMAPNAESGTGVGIEFYPSGNNNDAQRAPQARITVKQTYYGVRPSFSISTTDYNSPYTAFVDRLVIDPVGNVGIGTSSPSSRLEVQHSLGTDGVRFKDEGGEVRLSIGQESGHTGNYIHSQNIDLKLRSQFHSGSGGNIIFQTGPSLAVLAEAMRIDKDGRVGIGVATVAPDNKLQVNGRFVTENEGIYAIGDKGRLGLAAQSNHYVRPGIQSYTTGGAAYDLLLNPIDGNVGIGLGSDIPDAKLAVKGQVHASEVRVTTNVPGPDYVFDEEYPLPSLEEVRAFITKHHHLAEVPSAKEMATDGIKLGEMNMLLLKKVEELTLYLIEMKTEIAAQRELSHQQQKEIQDLKNRIK